jgi:O-antigen/teichoic acid export membrane protein
MTLVSRRPNFAGRLARGASIYVSGLFIGKALVLVIQVVLGRTLGAATYGLYALGYSILTLIQWLGSLGLEQGVLRYCALYRSRGEDGKVTATLGKAWRVATCSSVLAAAALWEFSHLLANHFFFIPKFAGVLGIFALALPFLVWTRIFSTFAQARHDIFHTTVLQNVAQPLTNIVSLLVAMALGYRLYGALAAFLLGTVCSAGLGIYYLRRTLFHFASQVPDKSGRQPFFRYSLTLMLVGLSFQLILRMPGLLLGHWADAREVGLYSAGASFALAFNFVPMVFAQPSLPLMVEFHDTGQSAELRCLYRTVTRWTLAAVVPMFMFLALFRDQVMRLFGREFAGSGPVLGIVSLGWLVYYAKGPASGILTMTGRQNVDLVNMIGVAMSLGVGSYLAIPRYGAMGASAVSSAAMAIWAGVEFLQMKFIYGLLPWDSATLRHLSVSAGVAGLGIYLRSELSTPVAALLTLAAYGSLYVGLCIGHEDRLLIGTSLARARCFLERPSVANE